MKEQEKDILKSLFQKMPQEEIPVGFENRLMEQIHKKAAEKSRKEVFRSNVFMWLAIIGGIAAMFAIFAIVVNFAGWELTLSLKSFKLNIPYIDPFLVIISVAVLSLIMADVLIRKHIQEKNHENDSGTNGGK